MKKEKDRKWLCLWDGKKFVVASQKYYPDCQPLTKREAVADALQMNTTKYSALQSEMYGVRSTYLKRLAALDKVIKKLEMDLKKQDGE